MGGGNGVNTEASELTVDDVLAVFDGAAVQACPTCGGTAWRPSGDGEVCALCRPVPGGTA